jgi:hypothetical protein
MLDVDIPLWYFVANDDSANDAEGDMANELKIKKVQSVLKYRRVDIAGLKTGRRGKHHDLVQGIVQELTTLQPGSALEIPLADVGGIGLPNLRSAVHRAATSSGLQIETIADDGKFYVWKANSK